MNVNKDDLNKIISIQQDDLIPPKLEANEQDMFWAKKLRKILLIDAFSFCLNLIIFLLLILITIAMIVIFNQEKESNILQNILSITLLSLFLLLLVLIFIRILLIRFYLKNIFKTKDFFDVINDKSFLKKIFTNKQFYFWVQIILNPIMSFLLIKYLYKHIKKIWNCPKTRRNI